MNPICFVFAAAGFIAGYFYRTDFAIISAVVGFLIGMVIDLRNRLINIENTVKNYFIYEKTRSAPDLDIKKEQRAKSPDYESIEKKEIETGYEETEAIYKEKKDPVHGDKAEEKIHSEEDIKKVKTVPPPLPKVNLIEKEKKDHKLPESKYINYIKDFFLKGNIVARVGLLILFFGIAFLLKYATESGYFPIEARYISAASFAIVLLLIGWKLRESHRTYGLLLQGGAVGMLYIIVFTAAKLFGLIPLSMAFFLMVFLVIFSGILSVLQDARSTAWYGAAGGFLAPVLTSTGSGNHIALFTFYAVLNSGILLIAFKKSWRELNLLSFYFTFGIGTYWGIRSYTPELLLSTEFFLILFFIFFFTISILFALKQPPKLKGYIDGTLVFGLPVVSFTIQTALLKQTEYGLAISALILGFFYVSSARILWNRNIEGMRTLTEAFLSLGIVFLTLAIPLAVDGKWTSAAWAMEGAALIWVGIRQKRVIPRIGGNLLILGAGIFFLYELLKVPFIYFRTDFPVFNGYFLCCFIISISAIFASFYIYKNRDKIWNFEENFHYLLFIWGSLWWFVPGFCEIYYHVPQDYLAAGILVFISLSIFGFNRLSHILDWKVPAYLDYIQIPSLGLYLLTISVRLKYSHPFAHGGFVALPLAFIISYYLLYKKDQREDSEKYSFFHPIALYLLIIAVTWEISFQVRELLPSYPAWYNPVAGIIPALFALFIVSKGEKTVWPLRSNFNIYSIWGTSLPLVYSILWCVFAFSLEGDPSPMIYITFLNPIELSQIFIVIICFYTILKLEMMDVKLPEVFSYRWLKLSAGIFLFFTFNTIIARSVHFYAGIPFDWNVLGKSMVYHASLSIFWTVLALIITFTATRKEKRELWFTGTALLVLVVLKLFIVDFATSQTGTRIISGIAVGIIMLVIGFFAPVPPKKKEVSDE